MTGCSGWVRSLKGRHVTFTGFVYLCDAHYAHWECGELVKSYGGFWADDFSSTIDLVVSGRQGSLDYKGTGASRKLALAKRSNLEQSIQSHVHTVDAAGSSNPLEHH